VAFRQIRGRDLDALADALGDTPETVISVHQLRRRLCRAYIDGEPGDFAAVVLQGGYLPTEPTAYGCDVEAIWGVLQHLEGWDCVNVAAPCARSLGAILAREMGCRVRFLGDVYFVLARQAAVFGHPLVRRLAMNDLALLEAAAPGLWVSGYGGPRGSLAEGIVAAAVVEGRLVSIAHTYARTARHADIGAATLESWRRRGFATAATSIVARGVQETGQTPAWSAGEDNAASIRVVEKLGFEKVLRRTYVIPTEDDSGVTNGSS
jgi:hypothetical protein